MLAESRAWGRAYAQVVEHGHLRILFTACWTGDRVETRDLPYMSGCSTASSAGVTPHAVRAGPQPVSD